MSALSQVQSPDFPNQLRPTIPPHSRRARRGHRGGLSSAEWWHRFSFPSRQGLGGTQVPIEITSTFERPLSKLEELKARRFTAVGREERIARSLAVLREPIAVRLSEIDWQWLDEHTDIEDEFE